MSGLKFLFRADQTNVGDWWCPPFRYFPFKPASISDLIDKSSEINEKDILILGGGGIGSPFFEPYLERIKVSGAKVIVWGAGVDTVSNKSDGKLLPRGEYDLCGDFFDKFDEVGIRVFEGNENFRYVPCASCMSNLFFKYREAKPINKIGIYFHKRVPLKIQGIPSADNSGDNLEEKLRFLSSCEYVITNTYHGVYWATLLERKVIVLPFKSGLFSFKHKPIFCYDGNISDDLFHQAKTYSGALEDSRKLNLEYYKYLTSKYNLV